MLQLAVFESLGSSGLDVRGGLGLSYALGHPLGLPYEIPHRITLCITLSGVVRLKATDPQCTAQIKRALWYIGAKVTGSDGADATKLVDVVDALLTKLDLTSALGRYNVGEGEVPKTAKSETRSESREPLDNVTALMRTKF